MQICCDVGLPSHCFHCHHRVSVFLLQPLTGTIDSVSILCKQGRASRLHGELWGGADPSLNSPKALPRAAWAQAAGQAGPWAFPRVWRDGGMGQGWACPAVLPMPLFPISSSVERASRWIGAGSQGGLQAWLASPRGPPRAPVLRVSSVCLQGLCCSVTSCAVIPSTTGGSRMPQASPTCSLCQARSPAQTTSSQDRAQERGASSLPAHPIIGTSPSGPSAEPRASSTLWPLQRPRPPACSLCSQARLTCSSGGAASSLPGQ